MDWAKIMTEIGNIPTAAALRVHLDAAWRESDQQKEKIATLEKENAELLRENRDLRKKLEQTEQKPKESYIDGGNCLFKINHDNALMPTPLCHHCKLPIAQNPLNRRAWVCSGCRAVFTQESIQGSRQRAQKALGDQQGKASEQ